ncbi:11411_t:CDS:1 [Funneliformis geosporum]|nr:11411_t:CDS:1 [Funneliformis geosporum]
MVPGHAPKFKTIAPRLTKNVSDDIDSKLLEHKHFLTLANWIDDKDEDAAYIKNIPYNFQLVYRTYSPGSCSIDDLMKKTGSDSNDSFIIICVPGDRGKLHNISGGLKQSNYRSGGYIHENDWNDTTGTKNFLFSIKIDDDTYEPMIIRNSDKNRFYHSFIEAFKSSMGFKEDGSGKFYSWEIFKLERIAITNKLNSNNNLETKSLSNRKSKKFELFSSLKSKIS